MNNRPKLRGTLYATDWLADIKYIPDETEIVQVLFKNTRTGFFRNPEGITLSKGDWVAVEAAPGHDIGQVMMTGPLVRLQMKKSNVSQDADLKRIFRKASDTDMEKFREAREREHPTMIRSRQIAAELGLNMKIGDVEYQGDGAKAIFYYIADERVDFRKLIRILADTFKIRIEMKQIGARQEAGRIGGIGPCGRPLCCSSWMSRFVSVGTGAARIQDLSMNPQKLAGQCAKLKCCLNFETECYSEAAKALPPKDAVLYTQDAEYYQFKVDILANLITYSTDKHLAVNAVTITAERAREIIALNKEGVKPEMLENEKQEEPKKQEYVEIVGQDSLTRFDGRKGKNKKKGNQTKADQNPNAGSAPSASNTMKAEQTGKQQPVRKNAPQKQQGAKPQNGKQQNGKNGKPKDPIQPQLKQASGSRRGDSRPQSQDSSGIDRHAARNRQNNRQRRQAPQKKPEVKKTDNNNNPRNQ